MDWGSILLIFAAKGRTGMNRVMREEGPGLSLLILGLISEALLISQGLTWPFSIVACLYLLILTRDHLHKTDLMLGIDPQFR